MYLFLRFYLFIHERHKREAETQAEGEAGSLCEPNMGLDPRTLGSCPELKADAQPLSPPGAPYYFHFYCNCNIHILFLFCG